MEKLYRPTSKAFLKMAGERIHTPHPTPLDPPLAISHRNHQKSLAYFSHLAPLILFFFTKRQSKGRAMAQYTLPPLNTLLLPINTCKVTLLNVTGKYYVVDTKSTKKMHRMTIIIIIPFDDGP